MSSMAGSSLSPGQADPPPSLRTSLLLFMSFSPRPDSWKPMLRSVVLYKLLIEQLSVVCFYQFFYARYVLFCDQYRTGVNIIGRSIGIFTMQAGPNHRQIALKIRLLIDGRDEIALLNRLKGVLAGITGDEDNPPGHLSAGDDL